MLNFCNFCQNNFVVGNNTFGRRIRHLATGKLDATSFKGNEKGRPPRLIVERISLKNFSLLDFPEGMVVDDASGSIRWTPRIDQIDTKRITVIVSDGYHRDEQTFEIFSNHIPTIVSNPPRMALVGDLFKYQLFLYSFRYRSLFSEYFLPHANQKEATYLAVFPILVQYHFQ